MAAQFRSAGLHLSRNAPALVPPLSLNAMMPNRPAGTFALLAALLAFTAGATPPAHPPTGLWDAPPDHYCVPRLDVAMPAATPGQIVKALNQRSPRPGLRLRRIDGHRVVVAVVDADYLTQKMGSTGAALYLIAATYSLTSVAGIWTVQYDFAWGDHAAPGVYSRRGILAASAAFDDPLPSPAYSTGTAVRAVAADWPCSSTTRTANRPGRPGQNTVLPSPT